MCEAMPRPASVERVPAAAARTLLLDAQGLLDNPRRNATEVALNVLISQLGFVQIDSINIVQRAHHLTLGSRFDGYTPQLLTHLLEHRRSLFEHWTHDASAIPVDFFPYWKQRFTRYAKRAVRSKWWKERLGAMPRKTVEHVRTRIEREGPLQSRDFEHDGKSGTWWGWKPQKIALEHLWRSGELAIAGRVNFQKVYDLTERVFPEWKAHEEPSADAHLNWACRSAMQRLVIATPTEIAAFWNAISSAEAKHWCSAAVQSGELMPVQVEPMDASKPLVSYALADWRERLDRAPSAPRRVRLLCPFDPVVRDRKRLSRLFGFDYRFEAFVPAAKRVYGYYVMPLLEGDRLIGRVDPKFHRNGDGEGRLEIRALHLEPGVRMTRTRQVQIDRAVARLERQLIASER